MLRTRPEWEDFLQRRRDKIRIFGAAMGLGCLLMAARLWHLQVIEHSELAGRAESNRIRQVTLEGKRGVISDRSGVPLVVNRPAFQLSIVPEDTPDPKAELAILADKIDLDIKPTLARIRAARPFEQVVLARDLDREAVAFVEERRLELPGVALDIKPIRHYIHGSFAAHLLGYLGSITPEALAQAGEEYSMGDFVGQTGLEKEYEASLKGKKGMKRVEVDAAGRELAALGAQPSGTGATLVSSLDYDAQKAAEDAFEGRSGAAVALDPSTGEILVFVSRPAFDPNIFTMGVAPKKWGALSLDPSHPLQNRVTMGQYPPGSTFKVAMALAALEEKVVTPETEIHCPGYFKFGDKTFRCWKKQGHGAVNLHRAVVESCDVYFYTVGSRLGINRIEKHASRLGLGVKTEIKLGGEKGGLIPTEKWKLAALKEPWRPGETISCAIGQGYILATPLQLARMTAVVANGGRMITPTAVRSAALAPAQPPRQQPANFSEESLHLVREAMRGVVANPHGTAWRLSSGPYEYAGKTGTAQVVRMREDEAKDAEEIPERFRDHALFVAFAPYENPRIAVAVVAENSGHGGEVAAPIAKKIMDAYLAKLPDVKPGAVPKPAAPAQAAPAPVADTEGD